MLMTKRGGDDLTRRSDDNKRLCCGGEEATESLILGDLHLDSNEWCDPIQEVASNLSRTVVSLALSNGETSLFACSGIAIESVGSVASFITSASLVRALLYWQRQTKGPDVLKIEVCYRGNVYTGSLQEYDLDHDIALVNVMASLDVFGAFFDDTETLPHRKVVAVGRDFSGKLMATSGILTAGSSGSEDSQDIMLSTCKISRLGKVGHSLILMGILLA